MATHDYALLLKYPYKTLKFEDGKVYEVVQKQCNIFREYFTYLKTNT